MNEQRLIFPEKSANQLTEFFITDVGGSMNRTFLAIIVFLSALTFNLSPASAKDDPPKAGAEIRLLYSNLSGDSYQYTVSSFDLRNIRPYWKGALLEGKLKYLLVLTFDKNATDINVLDVYATYQLSGAFCVRFGQFKAPFDREYLTPTTAMQFIESPVGGLTVLGRDRGAYLQGSLPKGLLTFAAGVINGTGIEKSYTAKNKNGQDDQKATYMARMTFNPNGEYGYDQAMPGKVQDFKSTFGLAIASGQKAANTDLTAYSADFAVRYQGVTTFAEYQHKETKDTSPKITTNGIIAQAGYFVLPKLEPALRFSNMKIKNGASKTEMTLGVNYYLIENNAKLQLNYSRLENKSASGLKAKDDRILILCQIVI
jgi:hypothetical protein